MKHVYRAEPGASLDDDKIARLKAQRTLARKEGQWPQADEIRYLLLSHGVTVQDERG